jgi:hypothetical protein
MMLNCFSGPMRPDPLCNVFMSSELGSSHKSPPRSTGERERARDSMLRPSEPVISHHHESSRSATTRPNDFSYKNFFRAGLLLARSTVSLSLAPAPSPLLRSTTETVTSESLFDIFLFNFILCCLTFSPLRFSYSHFAGAFDVISTGFHPREYRFSPCRLVRCL